MAGSREGAVPSRGAGTTQSGEPPCALHRKGSTLSDAAPAGGPSEVRSDYFSEASFDDMGLSELVRRAIAERGYERPTPVQTATLRPILAGKDVIVRSKTGTGKTAAFGIPIIERIPAGRGRPSALIMAPTRELAIQVAEELAALSKLKGLRVATIYGGASMETQVAELQRGVDVLIATPGRLLDLVSQRFARLDKVQMLVLDEADRMLDMGFINDVKMWTLLWYAYPLKTGYFMKYKNHQRFDVINIRYSKLCYARAFITIGNCITINIFK